MSPAHIERVVIRMVYKVFEDTRGRCEPVVFGIDERGYELARKLTEALAAVYGKPVTPYAILVNDQPASITSRYPDAGFVVSVHGAGPAHESATGEQLSAASIPDVTGKTVLLIDDVIYSGKTMYAALQQITASGLPEEVRLAALIDRGHRKYPLDIGYLGLYSPTKLQEHVMCHLRNDGHPQGVWLESLSSERG
jgi:pyrimidine operon attenuation protein/uracil phosphoribosyltransferase